MLLRERWCQSSIQGTAALSQSVCQCANATVYVQSTPEILHSNTDRSPLRHVSLAVSFSLQPNQAFSRLSGSSTL